MAKVKKIDAPILVIGLGGTGFDAVMRIKHDFANRFETEQFADGSFLDRPARTEFVEIDSDMSVKSVRKYGMTLREDEFIDIGGNLRAIHQAMRTKPYISEWVDNSIGTLDVDGDGAGACRQVSRLFLFNKIEDIITRLQGKLSVLNNVAPGALSKNTVIQVKLIAGISGGTGSGIMLDIAYILKHIAATMPCQINMEAYVIMPDVTVAHVAGGDTVKTKIYHTNSYGFLKELDYWMYADDNGISLQQQYSDSRTITWRGLPFDDVHLLCAQNDQGVSIANAYEHNIGVISEYLVHCYESTDDSGNENFAVVNGQDGGATNAANAFSFQSARSNQRAIINLMKQNYPVPYRYHSLGAFSNAGENRMMELKEWNMIYDEAVSRIQEHPVQMGGAVPIEFQKAVLAFDKTSPTPAGSVRMEYNKRHQIPNMAAYDLDTLKDSDALGAPHGNLYTNFNEKMLQSHGDEEVLLTDAVWKVFVTEARNVGEDIERGPQYLLDLLNNGQNSISVQLDETIRQIENSYRHVEGMKPNHLQQCAAKYKTFDECSFLTALFKKKDYYNIYMSEVALLFDATRAASYYNALLTALNSFKRKLAAYIAVLSDLVSAINRQQMELRQELERCDISTTLFSIEALNENLTALFRDQERRDTFVKEMYRNTMNVSMQCMSNTVPKDQLPELLEMAIDSLRENQFISVGGMSLTQKISAYQNVSTGDAMANYVKTALCPRLTSGAQVMFSASTEAIGLPPNLAARTSLISIPAGEDDIARGINDYCNAQNMPVIIKRTKTNDRIFWVNDKGGMPMYFYSQMEMIRADYLSTRGQHKGYHLFMGNTNALNAAGMKDEMKQNWAEILPDPKIVRAVHEVGENPDALKKAEEVGVLVMEYNYPVNGGTNPSVEFFKNIYNKIGGIAISETTVLNALGEGVDVSAEKALAPLPSNKAAIEAAIEKLRKYREEVVRIHQNRSRIALHINHLEDKAKIWGDLYGVHNRMIPLDPSMDEKTTEDVKAAWKTTFDRAIRESLSWRPDLMAEIKMHIACSDIVNGRLNQIDQDIAELEKLLSDSSEGDINAKDAAGAAQLMLYKMIDVYPAQVTMNLGEDDDEEVNNTLFDNATDVDLLSDMFPEFATLPFVLRFCAWFAANGKKNRKCVALTERKDAGVRKLSKKKRVDEDIREIYDNALELKTDINRAARKLNNLYMEEAISEETNAFFKKVVQILNGELDAFIGTWEDEIEE